MFLPHYDIYCVPITEQTMEKCHLFVLYNKNVQNFQNKLCSETKTLAHHLTWSWSIQIKARHWLSIILKLLWLACCWWLASQPMKIQNELWLLYNSIYIYMTSSVIYYCTDICKNEIYLLSSSVLKRNVVSTLYNNTG